MKAAEELLAHAIIGAVALAFLRLVAWMSSVVGIAGRNIPLVGVSLSVWFSYLTYISLSAITLAGVVKALSAFWNDPGDHSDMLRKP
jgi:hypothetical protein